MSRCQEVESVKLERLRVTIQQLCTFYNMKYKDFVDDTVKSSHMYMFMTGQRGLSKEKYNHLYQKALSCINYNEKKEALKGWETLRDFLKG